MSFPQPQNLMSYEFFLSYARANYNEYLKKFFKELSIAIRDRLPARDGSEVGFFDQHLELGEEWDSAIAHALQTSKVMVCLYSPAYFSSDYCGREWHVFHQRRLLHAADKRSTGSSSLSPTIKPVIWIPLPPELPEVVAATQYMRGDSLETHNDKGLKHMRSMHNKYSTKYKEFIQDLADDIVDTGRRYPLPPLPELPRLGQLPSVFDVSPKVDSGSSLQTTTSSLRHVNFVFVAGAPEQFPSNSRKQLECYKEHGGRDWKPFFPQQTKPIRALAQYIAASEDLDFYSDELPFGSDLPNKIRAAEDARNLVILLLDIWTAQLPQYREVLQKLDELNYNNCSVLMPWDQSDNETIEQLAELRKGVRDTFKRWSRRYKSVYFRDEIKSIDELREQLRETLVQLQMEILNDADIEVFRRAEGDGPKTKPMV